MSDDLHETVLARLRAVGQRYTDGRRDLVDRLATAPSPQTIPELLERPPRVAQSSAYRNLAVLEQAGVVRRVVAADEFARYELAEALTGHHHHLICTTCGTVSDFHLGAAGEEALERAIQDAAGPAGFSVDGHRLDLVGRCRDCR